MYTLRLQRSHTMFTLCSHRIRYVFVRAISTLWQIMYRLYLYLFHTICLHCGTLCFYCIHTVQYTGTLTTVGSHCVSMVSTLCLHSGTLCFCCVHMVQYPHYAHTVFASYPKYDHTAAQYLFYRRSI